MCKLNKVKKKVFGIIIPKYDNTDITTDDLLNNDYLIIDYVGYWVAYGATTVDELRVAIEKEGELTLPTMQDSIRRIISSQYSISTNTFTVNEQIMACFISNILGQLNIVYDIYSNLVHIRNLDTLKDYLDGKIDIPNLNQIIVAYGGSFNLSSTLLMRLKEWLIKETHITQSMGTVIKKPESYDLQVALSVFIVLTGYHFTEDKISFHTNDDTSKMLDFLTNELIVYDMIKLKTKV